MDEKCHLLRKLMPPTIIPRVIYDSYDLLGLKSLNIIALSWNNDKYCLKLALTLFVKMNIQITK